VTGLRIARVELRVADVERSADHYAQVVGLTRSGGDARPGTGAPRDGVLHAPGGEALLALRAAPGPGPAPRHAAGLFHTAFRYPTRAQLGAALLRVAGARATFTGASDHLVSEALYLDDPDGLGIELYRDRPREQWPEPEPGERVHMDTRPLDLDALAVDAEGDATGVDLGHVHLKVGDLDAAVGFWTDAVGLDLMTSWRGQAAFLAADGYHHHVGVNTWLSLGAPLEPADGPGLDAVVLAGTGREEELRTPDGVRVVLES
jgi:catechol 2,3-dioxygenase